MSSVSTLGRFGLIEKLRSALASDLVSVKSEKKHWALLTLTNFEERMLSLSLSLSLSLPPPPPLSLSLSALILFFCPSYRLFCFVLFCFGFFFGIFFFFSFPASLSFLFVYSGQPNPSVLLTLDECRKNGTGKKWNSEIMSPINTRNMRKWKKWHR